MGGTPLDLTGDDLEGSCRWLLLLGAGDEEAPSEEEE